VRNKTLNQHNTENLIALIEGRNIAVALEKKKRAVAREIGLALSFF
jgi:hypothetical protein